MTRCRISVAPLIRITDGSFRTLARMISSKVYLYSEMYIARAVIRNPTMFTNIPYVSNTTCQLAGDDYHVINNSIDVVQSTGLFDSGFNINLGCPASSAHAGLHGAILLKDRDRLINLLQPVSEHCYNRSINLSVKLRIGVDEFTSYEWFVSLLRDIYMKCAISHFIVHARPARLDLNTKQNRTIPALNYDYVLRALNELNGEFGYDKLRIEVNGGISSIHQIHQLHSKMPALAGYMSGRWFDKNLMDLQHVDEISRYLNNSLNIHKPTQLLSNVELIDKYCSTYLAGLSRSTPVGYEPIRPLFSMFNGQIGSRVWRVELQRGCEAGGTAEMVVRNALKARESYIAQTQGREDVSYDSPFP